MTDVHRLGVVIFLNAARQRGSSGRLFFCRFQGPLIKDLGGKGQLGNNICLGGVAIERILLGGDIQAIQGLQIAIIVFNMQTIRRERLPLHPIGGAVINAL